MNLIRGPTVYTIKVTSGDTLMFFFIYNTGILEETEKEIKKCNFISYYLICYANFPPLNIFMIVHFVEVFYATI